MRIYEGDKYSIMLKLPRKLIGIDNLDIVLLIKIDEKTAIKKPCEVDNSLVIATLLEEDTIGLDGIYPYEIRLNNISPMVLEQDDIRIKSSLVVDENFVPRKNDHIDIRGIDERLKNVEKSTGLADMSGFATKEDLKNIQANVGKAGKDGADGKDGKSAYELAKDRGFEGSINDWLLSLKGEQGERGLKGEDGKAGINGKDGERGEKGIDGLNGRDGLSAYQIALENGFIGSESDWLLSLKGERGDRGFTGAKGDKGEQGLRGERGERGLTGEKGADGKNGKDGRDGIDGKNGKDGLNGTNGLDGKDGLDGRDGKDGQSISIIEVSSEDEALSLSVGNPNFIYYTVAWYG